MSKIISIIGAREIPDDKAEILEKIAEFFAKKGYILRSGGSWGSDSCAMSGYANHLENTEIYLPWLGFNENKSRLLWSQENWDLAAEIVSHWENCNLNSKIFHARNVSIILSLTNDKQSDLVVCYTEGGEAKEGTSTGILLAKKFKIPLFNIGNDKDLVKLRKYCKKL